MPPGPLFSPRLWLIVGLLVTGLAAGGVTGHLYSREAARHDREYASVQLSAVAALKAEQVAAWRRDLVGDVETIASNPLLARHLAEPGRSTAEAEETRRLEQWFAASPHHLRFRGVLLLDPHLRTVFSVGRPAPRLGARSRALAAAALRRTATVVTDLVPGESAPATTLYIVTPVRGPATAAVTGVLVMEVDPERELFPLAARLAGTLTAVETLLVRREGEGTVILGHVRHGDAARHAVAHTEHRACVATRLARHGGPDAVIGMDYRGVTVLAVARPVADTTWLVVAKVDDAEVTGTASSLTRLVTALTLLLGLLAIGLLALLRYRQRAAEYRRRLHEQAEHLVLLKRTEYLMRHASDAIYLATDDGRIIDANERAGAMYGYSHGEFLAMTARDLRAPEALGNYERQWRHAEERAGLTYETRHRRKDGTTFPVEISVRVIEVNGQRLRQAIMRDVTDRRSLEARLRLAERLASVGTLAGGVAHEINNPLACVIANVEFALEELAPAPDPGTAEVCTALAEARQAAARVRDIVRALGSVAGQGLDGAARVDLRRVVEAAADAARRDLHGRARLVLDLCPLAPVAAPEAPLTQVFLALLLNAAQAIKPGAPEVNEVAVTLRRDAAGRVLVEVRDTGVGMTPELMTRIFDPFFSTKGVGGGMGLGLALCQGVVTSLGGEIEVESAVGRGSVFRVALPAAAPAAPVEAPPVAAAAGTGAAVVANATGPPASPRANLRRV
jgi:PAS domain S-box-containing protein